MPMKKGSSKRTISKNIAEFHTGKTYQKTRAKFGKETADKQAVAAAYRTAGKSKDKSRAREKKHSTENEFHRPL